MFLSKPCVKCNPSFRMTWWRSVLCMQFSGHWKFSSIQCKFCSDSICADGPHHHAARREPFRASSQCLRLPRFMKVLTAVRKRLLFKNEVGIQEINQPSRLVTPFAAGSPAHQVPFSYKLKRSRSSLLLCRYMVRASEPALVTVQPKPERGISFQSLTAWHFQRSPELVINSLDTRCIELLRASQHTNHGLANAASSDH